MKVGFINGAKQIARIAVMSATLIVGKFALSFIPNIEVVTTLVIVYAFVFKYDCVFATLVFCTADAFIYPPTIDVIVSYFIYWNLLSILVSTLSELKVKNFSVYLVVGLIMTALFGVITSLLYSLFYGVNFFAIYVAGLYFYALQLVSTLVFMLVGFKPLTKVLLKIKQKIQ